MSHPPKGWAPQESNTLVSLGPPRTWIYQINQFLVRDGQWIYMQRLTENSQGDLIITFHLAPFKYLVVFVVDTEAQMSAFQTEVAALVDYGRQENEFGK